MAKILCVLYSDPITGYPTSYARNDIPEIKSYPGGQSTPTPKQIDFTPGQLLGSVSGGLSLRKYLESHGHMFIVTSDKEGADLFLRKNFQTRILSSLSLFGPLISPRNELPKRRS